jgi:ketosteroid isomerase-like protein
VCHSADDWHAVYDVLVRYAAAIDRQDFEGAGDCFTADASATYGGIELRGGRPQIVGFLRDAMATTSASTHLVGGVRIRIDGDQADAEQSAVAFRVENGRLLVRGLRYTDRLRRADPGWRIANRVHEALWSAEGGAVV